MAWPKALTPTHWQLRWQLLGGILALIAAITAIIGGVSYSSLHGYLQDRLDQQVTRTAQLVVNGPGDPSPGSQLELPGRPIGTVIAFTQDGAVVTGAVLDIDGAASQLTDAQSTPLTAIPEDGKTHTVSIRGVGEYRAIAVADVYSIDGDAATLIVALPLAEVDAAAGQLLYVIVVVGVIGLLLAALVGTLIVRLALRPLDRVAAVAGEIADMPLDRGEVDLSLRVPERDTAPDTEVGRVGAAFNRMVGHVDEALRARHASEEQLRSFVADASHELRTPLASIRGYAELTRRSGEELPEDARYALGRVEAESVRMTGLVEDLLLLARLDAAQELTTAPVDLAPIVEDAVRDAEAAGPEHPISLELPADPVIVDGDARRLPQVVANLLANARVHTPAGTAVRVELTTEADAAVLVVEDRGPGIPPDLQQRLFARFVRGDASRSRAAGSTGLGLAIVQALVAGHRGTIGVASVPGRTTFTIRLPLARTDEVR